MVYAETTLRISVNILALFTSNFVKKCLLYVSGRAPRNIFVISKQTALCITTLIMSV
jgi:hypothetical protein